MSVKAERVLVGLLPDRESLEYLVRQGFTADVLPTEELVEVVDYSIDYFSSSGRAPTPSVLTERFTDLLADCEIALEDEPEESMRWALDTLIANHVKAKANAFTRAMAVEMAEAAPEDRLRVAAEFSATLAAMVSDLAPRTSRVDMRETAMRVVEAHDRRREDPEAIHGLAFGLDEIDRYYNGIHDGEICVVAAGPKFGKSMFLNWTALREWERGRSVAIYTLENSIEMTELRLACMATHVSMRDLQTGSLSEADRDKVVEWIEDVLRVSDTPLHVIQPPTGQRTPQAIVQQALALEVDSLIVDQLSFVEPVRRRRDQSRAYEIAETMRDFKSLISGGQYKVPLLMAHQIKREGVKNAEKTGRLSMSDMADSSEVERASDLVFGLYAPEDMLAHGGMQLQALACRRLPTRSYDMHWQIGIGSIGVRNEVEL